MQEDTQLSRRHYLASGGVFAMAGCLSRVPNFRNESYGNLEDTWRMRSHDGRNSGYSPMATPPREQAAESWTGPMIGGNLPNAPAVDEQRVYSASDEFVYSFTRDDGKLEWVAKFDGLTFAIAPTIGSENIYVAEMMTEHEDRGVAKLVSIDPESGNVVWELEAHITSSPILSDDWLYFANQPDTGSGYLAAVDGAAGEILWQSPFAESGSTRLTTEPAIVDDIVIACGHIRKGDGWQGRTIAFDRNDGSEIWSVDVDNPISASPVAYDDSVFVCEINGRVSALEKSTGVLQWRNNLDSIEQIFEPPAVASHRLFIIGYRRIGAYDVDSGEEVWFKNLGDVKRSFVVTANDAVYITRDRILSLNQEDGEELWSIEKSGYLVSFGSPSVAGKSLFSSSCIKQEPMDYYDINTHCVRHY